MKIVFAMHPSSDSMLEHGKENSGVAEIDFFTGEVAGGSFSTNDMRLTHAILMVLAWMIFAPAGIFIARFGHKYKWWFYVHIAIMVAAAVLCIVGLAIGIIMTSSDFKQTDRLILIHSFLGLFVTIGACAVQPILGFIADKMYDPNRKSIPVWPDKIHWLIGRYSYVAAAINILIGMLYLALHYVYFILFFIVLLLQVVLYHYLDLVYCIKNHTNDQSNNNSNSNNNKETNNKETELAQRPEIVEKLED